MNPTIINPGASNRAGFLTPKDVQSFLSDDELENFIQQFVAGVTGLPGSLVRPSYQANPPALPPASVTWCGVYVQLGDITWDGVKKHVSGTGTTPGYDVVTKWQEVDTLCTFYGPQAGYAATLLHMGVTVPQNLELLRANSFTYGAVGKPATVPEMVAGVYQRRIDVPLTLRRAIQFFYGVLDLTVVPAKPSGVQLSIAAQGE